MLSEKRAKKLFATSSKSGSVQNTIYGLSDSPLVPNEPDRPMQCVFTVQKSDGTQVGYLFDNLEYKGEQVWVQLRSFIEDSSPKRMFYKDVRRKTVHTYNPYIELQDLIFACYHGISPKEAQASKVRMVIYNPCATYKSMEIFDFTKKNLISEELLSPIFSSGKGKGNTGCIVRDGDSIIVNFMEKEFMTDYNCDLYVGLQQIKRWRTSRGALIAQITTRDDARSKCIGVAFAEIVWLFHQNKLNKEDFTASIVDEHKKLMDKGIVIDHLTHNKENNYVWALAAIPQPLNTQMKLRDNLKPPYYFFTVFDKEVGKFKVKCGVYGLGWEKRYLISDLTYKNPDASDVYSPRFETMKGKQDNTLYGTLFDKFKKRIGSKNIREGVSLLRKWSDPKLRYDEKNILTDMLFEPIESYVDVAAVGFKSADWADMPIV